MGKKAESWCRYFCSVYEVLYTRDVCAGEDDAEYEQLFADGKTNASGLLLTL